VNDRSRTLPESDPRWSRRQLLGSALALPALGALPTEVLAQPAAAGAPSADAARSWLALRARLDGRPAFWFARGTEYVLVDGVATPYNGRVVVMASIVQDLGGGAYDLPYMETLGSVTPTGYDYSPTHRHPITGDPISTVVTPPFELSLKLGADGRITQYVEAKGGVKVTYDGYFWDSPGFGGDRTASSKIDIHLRQADGTTETLTELTALRAPTGGRAARGFVPAESVTTTSRSVADPQRYNGKVVYTVGSYFARKYPTVESLRADLRPVDLEKHQAFFDRWQGWAKEHA
jgi:hypothetical protein